MLGLAIPLGIVGLAIGIRLFNILALDPFGDEVTWLRWAIDHFDPGQAATYWTTLDDEGRPPLFFWLILITLPIDPNAFVGGRVAAALASGATAGMLYAVGAQLAPRSVGVVAALLWAVLPFGVIFGRLASSDDALLALCLALVMWAAIRAVREPSYRSGAVCGAAIALAILAKTLGLLALAIPVCAAVALARGVNLRRLLRAIAGMVIVLVIGVSPLLPWAPGMLEKADDHAELDVEQQAGAGPKHDAGYRLSLNMGDAGEYLVAYLGAPILIFATGGLASGVLQRNRNVLFLGLAFAAGVVPVLLFTTVLYSRYLLGFSLPIYLLAAMAMCQLWRGLAPLCSAIVSRNRMSIASAGIVGGVTIAALFPQLTLTRAMLFEPSLAVLPGADHWRYFQHHWSLFGLSQHVEFLKQEARRGQIKVVMPRESAEYRFELPYDALRFYFRATPTITFDDIPPMRGERSDREHREITEAHRPTYIVINEEDPNAPESGDAPPRVPENVRRSFPAASVAHKTVRPEGGYAITLYRADAGAQLDASISGETEALQPARDRKPGS